MNPPPRISVPDIRIRAVSASAPERGAKAPDVTLSMADKAELRRIAEIVEYKTVGSQIFSQRQEANFLHLLVDGVVRASRTFKDGERQVLAFFWPGDLFGLSENGAYLNSTEALTPCTVYRFPARRLERFLIEHPSIEHTFLTKAIHDLRSAQRNVIVLGRLDVCRRLAAFLIDCSVHEKYYDAEARKLIIAMTRYDIADYLGTSAESIIRAFGQLEQKGLIHRLTARSLELRIAELEAFVGLE